MDSETLEVFYAARIVGILRRGNDGSFSFTYSRQWIDSPDAFAISLSLPLSDEEHSGGAAQRFFTNLLPEGRMRVLVCRRLGISEENDFELLKAIGGECAGALSLLPPDHEKTIVSQNEYKRLTLPALEKLEKMGSVYPVVAHSGGTRLSLAGAQDKLPVLYKDNKVFLPLGNSPSSHIFKLPNRDFKYLPVNETLMNRTARALGLAVVSTMYFPLNKADSCLVTRYDRRYNPGGQIVRVHQEDFCQALGIAPFKKYEQEGGPSFARCFALVVQYSSNPMTDTGSLLAWLAFNVLCGNSDGHAKNLSLLYGDGNSVQLAPFYDLVCTACYPGLDTRLAMSIGGCSDPGQLRGKHWRLLAEQTGIRYSYLKGIITAMAESLPGTFDTVSAEFRKNFHTSPVIQMIKQIIHQRTRRILKMLNEE
jgi:serine/threonine-protein kinase HipA